MIGKISIQGGTNTFMIMCHASITVILGEDLSGLNLGRALRRVPLPIRGNFSYRGKASEKGQDRGKRVRCTQRGPLEQFPLERELKNGEERKLTEAILKKMRPDISLEQ